MLAFDLFRVTVALLLGLLLAALLGFVPRFDEDRSIGVFFEAYCKFRMTHENVIGSEIGEIESLSTFQLRSIHNISRMQIIQYSLMSGDPSHFFKIFPSRSCFRERSVFTQV